MRLYKVNRGISSSSRRLQRYSPRTIMVIVAAMCTIHHSIRLGKPPYQILISRCIKKSVTVKSKHFLLFSTINASKIDLTVNERVTRGMRVDDDIMRANSASRRNKSSIGRHLCESKKRRPYPAIAERRIANVSGHPCTRHSRTY
jgi:hypothetical protein